MTAMRADIIQGVRLQRASKLPLTEVLALLPKKERSGDIEMDVWNALKIAEEDRVYKVERDEEMKPTGWVLFFTELPSENPQFSEEMLNLEGDWYGPVVFDGNISYNL